MAMFNSLAVFVTALCALVAADSLLQSGRDDELIRYRERVIILHDLLKSECADFKPASSAVQRRQLSYDELVDQTDLVVEKQLYTNLRKLYVECQLSKSAPLVTRPRPTEPPTTTTTTTTEPTTTQIPTPDECYTADNLTESWRLDHSGSNIKPVKGGLAWQCDPAIMKMNNRPWFRFSQDAGVRMLDGCPKSLSCGSAGSIWSNHRTDIKIGDVTPIKAYTRYGGNCQHVTWELSVMRCSNEPNDLIYRYDDDKMQCYNAFCGMM